MRLPDQCHADAAVITPNHLTAWAAGLVQDGYTPATHDQRISKVKAFFAWAQREQLLASNPAVHLKRPRQTWLMAFLPGEMAMRIAEQG